MLQGANTEAGGNRNPLRPDVEVRRPDALAQTFGNHSRVSGGRVREYNHKLLAAEPGNPVLAQPQIATDARDELFQHLVTNLVAVLIVHELEVVDVAHHQRQRPLESDGALDLTGKLRLEEGSTSRAGQLVNSRQHAVVTQCELQRSREIGYAPGNREMSPEVLAARITRHTVVSTRTQGFRLLQLIAVADEH